MSRAAIDAREDTFDLAPWDRSGNSRLLVRASTRDCAAEIRRDDPLPLQEAQQNTKRAGSVSVDRSVIAADCRKRSKTRMWCS